MEAMETILELERELEARRARAEETAGELKASARRAGEALLEKIRAEAAEQAWRSMTAAERRAEEQKAVMVRETEAEQAAIRKEGERRLKKAADFIVERVVKG